MYRDEYKPDDHELHAYVDGQLAPGEAADLEARLAADPAALTVVESYLEQNRLIRAAADALAPAAIDLRTATLERLLARRLEELREARSQPVMAWLRQTAAAVVLVGAGWLAHDHYVRLDQPQATPFYVAEAVGAHRVFAGDGFRPVEFRREASEIAVQWASAKLGHPLAIPALDALGLGLVGSRVHGTAAGAVAQFIYEDGAGHRLSLVVATHPSEAPPHGFTLAQFGETKVGYWSDSVFDYAVVAETSAPQLEAIAFEIGARTAGS